MAFLLRRGHGVPIYTQTSAACKFFGLLKNPHRVFREESHEHRKAETGSHVTPAFQASHPPLACLRHRPSDLTVSALLLRGFPLKGRRRESICSSSCSRGQQAYTAHLSAGTFSLGSWIRGQHATCIFPTQPSRRRPLHTETDTAAPSSADEVWHPYI